MTRWILAAVGVALIAWFGLKDRVYRAVAYGGTPVSAEAPDYARSTAWAARPESRPPGAWDRPWGVDIFLIPPGPTIPHFKGHIDIDIAEARAQVDAATAAFSESFGEDFPIYAPRYRRTVPARRDAPDAAKSQDLAAAFENYMDEDNRGRAVLFAGLASDLPDMRRLAAAHDDLFERVAGYIVFGADDQETAGPCSPGAAEGCLMPADVRIDRPITRFVLPALPDQNATYRPADPETLSEVVAARAISVSAWLDENAEKPAEPLPDFETIEIAPVRRPGETD